MHVVLYHNGRFRPSGAETAILKRTATGEERDVKQT